MCLQGWKHINGNEKGEENEDLLQQKGRLRHVWIRLNSKKNKKNTLKTNTGYTGDLSLNGINM